MVEYGEASLDPVFGALADPTRRALLGALREGPARISELARPFPVSFAAVSKHLGVLERAGLVRRQVKGRDHYFELRAARLEKARNWLDDYRVFLETRLDALDRHLRAKKRTMP